MKNFKKMLSLLFILISFEWLSLAMEEHMNFEESNSDDEMDIDENFDSDEDSEECDLGYLNQIIEQSLIESVKKGDMENVRQFSKIKNMNFNLRDNSEPNRPSLLSLASARGYSDIVKFLLENGADVNFDDGGYCSTALHKAASNLHPEVVEILLEVQDIKINAKDKGKCTPFNSVCWTIMHNRSSLSEPQLATGIKIAKLLLKYIPDSKLIDLANTYYPCKNLAPIIREIFERIANNDQFDKKGLLYIANNIALYNSELGLEILKKVVSLGVDANEKNKLNKPISIHAILIPNNKLVEIFETLLQTNIDLTATDGDGRTVLDWANNLSFQYPENRDYPRIIEMIKEKLGN